MTIDRPTEKQTRQLRALWQEAFGDSDEFLDMFRRTAFSPDRCRCVTVDGEVASALYWFDCEYEGGKIAYVYAVATARSHRGKGYCQALLKDTHAYLSSRGYIGAMLSPGSDSLYDFYTKMGYNICTYIKEFDCPASRAEIPDLREIGKVEYASLRRAYLPEGSVIQENESLDFLEGMSRFYAGDDFVLVARKEKSHLVISEMLGNTDRAGEVVSALGCNTGSVRTVGGQKPFTMYRPLGDTSTPPPKYFGLVFD